MTIPPVPVTLLALPNAKEPVLQSDGTLTVPWRRAIQQLYAAATSGGSSAIPAIIAELAALAAELATVSAEAAQAAIDAAQALDEADTAQALAMIGLTDEIAPEAPGVAEALLLVALGNLDAADGGGSALEVLEDSVSLTAGATSLNFEGAAVALSATGGAVTIKVGGYLPLVNGDLPGPVAIADGVGQFIGVPLV